MDLKVQGRFIFFPEFLVRTQLIKIRGRIKRIAKIGKATKSLWTLGGFTPKGSHTCNWLKPKQLRLFFAKRLVRVQLRCEDVKSVLHKSIEIMVPTSRSTITKSDWGLPHPLHTISLKSSGWDLPTRFS